jgi:HEAT repeat protein
MPDHARRRPDLPDDASPATLAPGAAAGLTEFARACRAAARAVSLYPGGHPAIASTLTRLAALSREITAADPFAVQALSDRLLVDGAGLPRPDPAATELAGLLHRHAVARLTVRPEADIAAWHTLFLLLARSPDEVRCEGGIARLWQRAGAPGVDLEEIDYAEVLREKEGTTAAIEVILSAVKSSGAGCQLGESVAGLVSDVIADPTRTEALMRGIEESAADWPGGSPALFEALLRATVQRADAGTPADLDATLSRFGELASRLSAPAMAALLERRHEQRPVAGADPLGAVLDRMSDGAVAGFVTRSVVAGHGASERLAHAFTALAPEMDRQRQLLGLARAEAQASSLGEEPTFPELWTGVETMLTSYTDETFVSASYATELSKARTQPVDVEGVTDDPGDRIAAWVSSVSDAALRDLDRALLVDLLAVEPDPLRWRDMAYTVVGYADDLIRNGWFGEGWQLLEAVVAEGAAAAARQPHATAALAAIGPGAMISVSAHLRTAPDSDCRRFAALCRAIGPQTIEPLALALAAEPDGRARRRLREIVIGFGPDGRGAVQQLMHSKSWEVRRTAAHLLREFGGAEGLAALIPLLTDPEPLVQREAVHSLVINSSPEAAAIVLAALTRGTATAREAIGREILSVRDDRAAITICRLVQQADARLPPLFHLGALAALGSTGTVEAIAALESTLRQGGWRSPMRSHRCRAAAAHSLRCIGTPAAIDRLRTAAASGSFGARWAARAELAHLA